MYTYSGSDSIRKGVPYLISLLLLISFAVPAIGVDNNQNVTTEQSDAIAHWALDETTGNIAYDSTTKHNGTIKGALINQPGKIGQCYYFDGERDYVQVNSHEELNFNNGEDFSIFAWINTTFKDYGRIVEKRAGAAQGERGYSMAIWNDGTFYTFLDFPQSISQQSRHNPKTQSLIPFFVFHTKQMLIQHHPWLCARSVISFVFLP